VWWERFASVSSAVAVILSAIAIGLSGYQASLMRDQLTAADQNKAIQTTLEKMQEFCKALRSVPFSLAVKSDVTDAGDLHAGWIATLEEGAPFDRAAIETWGNRASTAAAELSFSIDILSVWLDFDHDTVNSVEIWVHKTARDLNSIEGEDFERHGRIKLGNVPKCLLQYSVLAKGLTGKVSLGLSPEKILRLGMERVY
jgi:hypothetical protein